MIYLFLVLTIIVGCIGLIVMFVWDNVDDKNAIKEATKWLNQKQRREWERRKKT